MLTVTNIDEGHAFDWGKTSLDYAGYRPGYPASFYTVSRQWVLAHPDKTFWIAGLGRVPEHVPLRNSGLDVRALSAYMG